ncbi:hypothetical protein ACFQH6_19330 [Halobacteriaceae archaeon GCM10025711]
MTEDASFEAPDTVSRLHVAHWIETAQGEANDLLGHVAAGEDDQAREMLGQLQHTLLIIGWGLDRIENGGDD